MAKKSTYKPGPDTTGANPGFGKAPSGTSAPTISFPQAVPTWLQGLSNDEIVSVINTFNSIYGTRYDTADRAAFLRDSRLNDAGVQAVVRASVNSLSTIDTVPGFSHLAGEDRAQIQKEGGHQVVVPTVALGSAATANPKSVPYLQEIQQLAQQYGVPWQVIWGVANHESSFDPHAIGDNGNSHGLAQIYQPAHPEISLSQANDPHFALDFIARNLATNYQKFHDWSLAVLAHNSPAAAAYLYNSGTSAPKRAAIDAQYIDGVFTGLDKLGFDFKDTKLASGQAVGSLNGGGSGSAGSAAVKMPDPATMRQNAHDYLSKLFFREPSTEEIQALVGVMQSAIIQSAGSPGGADNPFQAGNDPALAHGVGQSTAAGLVSPLGKPFSEKDVTSQYGVDRGTHRHAGIDLAANTGDPVMAAASGYASVQEDPKGYGKYVVVKGDDGRTYFYAHLSSSAQVDGVHVTAGQQIGAAGASGDATGPHLHFEIRAPNGPGPHGVIDPTPELKGGTVMDAGTTGSNVSSAVDPSQRATDAVHGSSEYQRLYGAKPAWMDDNTYAQQFQGTADKLLGPGQQVSGDAIRAGLSTGQEATTAGYAAGTPGASDNATFRQMMFRKAAAMNQVL